MLVVELAGLELNIEVVTFGANTGVVTAASATRVVVRHLLDLRIGVGKGGEREGAVFVD